MTKNDQPASAEDATDATVEQDIDQEQDEDQKAWDEFDQLDKQEDEAAAPPEDKATPVETSDEEEIATLDDPPKADETAGQEDDIWTEATDAQRDAFKAAQGRASVAEAQDRRTRGSISGMQRQINELSGQLADKAKPGEDTDGQAETDDEWDAFAKEYPEVAGPVEKRLNAKDEKIDTLSRSLAAVSDTHKANLYERNEERLATQHSDWEVVMGVQGSQKDPAAVTQAADKFADWLGQQPAYLQQAAIRNSDFIVDPEEAAHVIGIYKLANGIGQKEPASGDGKEPAPDTPQPKALSEKRKRQIESSATPRTRGPGPVTTGIPDDPKGAWDAFEKMGL